MKPIDIIVGLFVVCILGFYVYKIIYKMRLRKKGVSTSSCDCGDGCSSCNACSPTIQALRAKGRAYKKSHQKG